ncbi:MAG: GxxExxY protein [Ardenticatenaceae bacterium]|nr:GxxExxY protein [Ardenticatenaceae bacterium]MCB8987033.1 GxxExxY protein [Ardenticatenaceae bacterium]
MLHEDITDKIIKGFFKVYNTLGYGFLEKVYENALMHELRKQGLVVQPQQRIRVHYDQVVVGDYFADLLVANKVIVELKSAQSISADHIAQLMNYLKATDIEVGLLLNFGPNAQFKRRLLTNDKKPNLHP